MSRRLAAHQLLRSDPVAKVVNDMIEHVPPLIGGEGARGVLDGVHGIPEVVAVSQGAFYADVQRVSREVEVRHTVIPQVGIQVRMRKGAGADAAGYHKFPIERLKVVSEGATRAGPCARVGDRRKQSGCTPSTECWIVSLKQAGDVDNVHVGCARGAERTASPCDRRRELASVFHEGVQCADLRVEPFALKFDQEKGRSAVSAVNVGVEPLKLDAGVGTGELPVDGAFGLVATLRPGGGEPGH